MRDRQFCLDLTESFYKNQRQTTVFGNMNSKLAR